MNLAARDGLHVATRSMLWLGHTNMAGLDHKRKNAEQLVCHAMWLPLPPPRSPIPNMQTILYLHSASYYTCSLHYTTAVGTGK